MLCDRCANESEPGEAFDYCPRCGANLCPECMEEGCCGEVPAVSGQSRDVEDEQAWDEQER